MKQRRRWKGLWIFLLAALVVYTLLGRAGSDIYTVELGSDNFLKRYLADPRPEDTQPLTYTSEQEGTVAVYTPREGALSLEAGQYDAGLLYAGADENTVLKIFSSDHSSPDNSGGRVLAYQPLDPAQVYCRVDFALQEDIDSLYIEIETNAPDFAIENLHMASAGAVCNDTALYCALTVLCALALFWLLNARFARLAPATLCRRSVSPPRLALASVLVCAGAVCIASLPLLQQGVLSGHDYPYQMARIEGLASGLASGQFPVRVHGDLLNGFGYPNSCFYPELLLYPAAVLSLAGVHTVTCYKLYLVAVHVLTFVLSYFPFKKLLHSRQLGMILATLYLLNPYRLICAYYRAAIGEYTALAFLPLVLYGMYAVLLGEKRDWPWLVAGATGLIQSHILTTELTALLCGVLLLAFIRRLFTTEKRVYSLLVAGVFTVAINLWFLGPMLLMSVTLHPAVYTRVQNPLGFATSSITRLFTTTSLTNLGPHPVGWVALFALAFYLLHRFAFGGGEKSAQQKDDARFFDVLVAASLTCIFATTAYFPWEVLLRVPLLGRILDVVQFPYRLLSLAGVCAILLAGRALVLWLRPPHRQWVGVAAVCLAVFTTGLLVETAFLDSDYPNKHYVRSNLNNSLCVGQYEYLPGGATIEDIVDTSPAIQSDNPTLTISEWQRAGTRMQFHYQLDPEAGSSDIILPLLYIPRYRILVNGQPVDSTRTESAHVIFTAPAAEGVVEVAYREPLLFRLCEVVSLLALVALLCRRRLRAWLLPRLPYKGQKKRQA